MTASTFILAALAASALVAIVWRLASRRRSLPCPVWLRWLVELDNPFTKTNRAAFIVETLSLSPGMAVLDAGCGPGRLTVPLARGVGPSGRVLAIDIQAGMLARAKAKTAAAGLANVEFLTAGLGDGALPRTCFDRAVLVTVLGEIPDRQSAFVELFQCPQAWWRPRGRRGYLRSAFPDARCCHGPSSCGRVSRSSLFWPPLRLRHSLREARCRVPRPLSSLRRSSSASAPDASPTTTC